MSAMLEAGFADPVRDAQRCFRAVLDAMARPGRIAHVSGVTPPSPLDVATAAVALTLVDHETKLWLDPAAGAAREWLRFHCGAPLTDDLAVMWSDRIEDWLHIGRRTGDDLQDFRGRRLLGPRFARFVLCAAQFL